MRSTSALMRIGCLLVLSVLAGWPHLFGCATARAELPPNITIFYSNDAEAKLYMGGGPSMHHSGGISRRVAVIAANDDPAKLIVDVGNFSGERPGNPYEELKLEYLLRSYAQIGCSVMNAGQLEAARGKSSLQELAVQSGNRLISANIVDSAGQLVLPPYEIVQVKGLRVGIVGLAIRQEDKYAYQPPAPPDPLQMNDPVSSLRGIWDRLEKESDIQVLLGQLTPEQISEVIVAFPRLDVVLGGPGWDMQKELKPWDEQGVVIGKTGFIGRYLGQLVLTLHSDQRSNITIGGYSGEAIKLDQDLPVDPATESLLAEFANRMRSGEVIQDVIEKHTEGQQFGYAGAFYCYQCHGEIYAGWLKTGHSQAYKSLVDKGEENNPGCLECHTVGYAEQGGYLAKSGTYLLASVQCESCHGAGAEHMRVASEFDAGKIAKPSDWAVESRTTSQATCITCHDTGNDPHWKNGKWPYDEMVEHIGCSKWLQEPVGN